MTYIKFEPLRQMENKSNVMDKVFGDYAKAFKYDSGYNPRTEVAEDENAYYIDVEIPGVKKEEVKITLNNNVLAVSGEKKPSDNNKNKMYYRNERNYGSFSRSFSFSEKVNPDSVEAKSENGVLSVKVEKLRKTVTERVIEIK
jgi:HSP20 family protein